MDNTTEKKQQAEESNLPCCSHHSGHSSGDGKDGGKGNLIIGLLVLLNVLLFFGFYRISDRPASFQKNSKSLTASVADLESEIFPKDGAVLPAQWNGLGKKMIAAGVIDAQKFESLYAERLGGLSDYEKNLLYGDSTENLKINQKNAGVMLNLLWALGLSNKNEILEKGPMTDPKYGSDAGRFASTGGWTLAQGKTMDHYSKHQLVVLTKEQEELVKRVSQNIYRPCCGNSTYFPDCNHGMAMLGFLELAASQGASEKDLYRAALALNSYWFPENYLNIAKYLKSKGLDWKTADPMGILAENFSSGRGYRQILSEIQPVERKSGGSCGV